MITKPFLMFNTWTLRSINGPIILNFLEDNILQYNGILHSTWQINVDRILIKVNNGFSTLNGSIIDGKIIGKAINVQGKIWDFIIERRQEDININYLIENDWTIKYIADVEVHNINILPVNFLENKVFKYKDTRSSWNVRGRFLEIQINNSYVTLNAEILSGCIKGKAKNIVGLEWDFEIFPRNDENQKKINHILLDKRWELKDYNFPDDNYALEYFTLHFLEKPNLIINGQRGDKSYNWEIKGNKVLFFSIDKFITYECSINDNNVLECKAENIKGVTFSAYFEQIIETKQPVLSDKLLKIDTDYRQYQFQLNGNHKYTWTAIWSYYPKNRFRDDELSEIDLQNRYLTYNFKDGSNPIKFAQIFASAILRYFDENTIGEIEQYSLAIIPASNKLKTDIRFKDFCNYLISLTGLIDGFDLISNRNISKEPIHQTANREIDLRKYIKVDNQVNNKKIVVIDDVRTSGNSSNVVYDLLKEKGAQDVIFFYLAKTVGFKV